jgi:tRNA uridine 5-carboxymethylaminomethyl modification enzyme
MEDRLSALARESSVAPADANPHLAAIDERPIAERQRVAELVKRPGASLRALLDAAGRTPSEEIEDEAWVSAEIEMRYAGYLARERESAARLAELAEFSLPPDLPYLELASLSTEARQKLDRVRPESLGQASRIPGVSPSDLQGIVHEVVQRRRASA